MIKNVFFDLDDTLFDFKIAEQIALKKTLCNLGIEPKKELMDRYVVLNLAQWKRLEKGELTLPQVKVERFRLLFEEMCKDIVGDDATGWAKRATAYYEEMLCIGYYYIDGALELVKAIKAHGMKAYIVTNGTARVQRSRLSEAEIGQYIDGLFISEEIGYPKPGAEYFAEVFKKIPPFEINEGIIIGDSLTSDIKGGKNTGLPTIWLNRHGETAETIVPDYEIHNLCEVYDILGIAKN